MKRITPEMALEAYQKTGLKPMQGDYFPKEGCACGMGVVMKHLHPEIETKMDDTLSFDRQVGETFGRNYKAGFANGFDGNESLAMSFEPYNQGYEDGVSAWEAVKHLVEVESK